MKNLTRLSLLLALSAASAPLAAHPTEFRLEPSPKEIAAIQALTPDAVAGSVIVNDDDLETIAKLATETAYKSNGKFTDRVRSDNFFRAFVVKKTGEVRYQLSQTIVFMGPARRFDSVNYATPSGPKSADLRISESRIDSCASSLCLRHDTLAFDISAATMKEIAAGYSAGNTTLWRFRFNSRIGLSWEDRISPAEAAGLLIAVEKFLIEHRLAK